MKTLAVIPTKELTMTHLDEGDGDMNDAARCRVPVLALKSRHEGGGQGGRREPSEAT